MRRLAPFLFGLALVAPGVAHAETDGFYRFYSVTPDSLEPAAHASVTRLVAACETIVYSRVGPSPKQVKRCNAAEAQLAARGAAGVRAAMAKLDDPEARDAAPRLYDVIARSRDLANVEPLIHALELEQGAGLGNERSDEKELIVHTLAALTYAAPLGTPAIQWRTWETIHHGRTREQLYAERRAEVDEQLAHGSVQEQVRAASFLAQRSETRAIAKAKLEALAALPNLTADDRSAIEEATYQLPVEETPPPPRGGPSVIQLKSRPTG
jgi:hypothetical protein